MQLRRNATDKTSPSGFPLPRFKEDIAICPHIDAELGADSEIEEIPDNIFKNQFNILTMLEANDGAYRLYLLCPQCKPQSLESLYSEIYGDLATLPMHPKNLFKDTIKYIKSKSIDFVRLPQLYRTHALGNPPQIGQLVHKCYHANDWNISLIFKNDGELDIPALVGDNSLPHPEFLILCPDCMANFSPEEVYEDIQIKKWSRRDSRWLAKCHILYYAFADFIEILEKLADKLEEEENDFEYDGPTPGEVILLCDHASISDHSTWDVIPLEDHKGKPYKVKNLPPLNWIAVCDRCLDSDIPAPTALARRKARKNRTHIWAETDQIKLLIKDIGGEFVFSQGLALGALVNEICEILERPDLFFDTEGPLWTLARDWAPKQFDTGIMETPNLTEDQIRQAQQAGDLWQISMEKHPTTGEESINLENTALSPENYDYALVVVIEYPSFGLGAEELAALDAQSAEAEQYSETIVTNNNGVKFRVATTPSRGIREFHFLFDNKFQAENALESFDEDMDVHLIEIED